MAQLPVMQGAGHKRPGGAVGCDRVQIRNVANSPGGKDFTTV